MCRIFIYLGDSSHLKEEFRTILQSFKDVSRYDWIFEKYTGGKEVRHSDGWGFIGLSIDQGVKTSIYKSITPFYEDDTTPLRSWISSAKGLSILMLHVRAKSPNMDRNIFSIHPLYVEAGDGSHVYLIHNGTIEKDKTAELIGEDLDSKRFKIYNDTYYALRYIVDGLTGFDARKVIDRIGRLSNPEYLYSALNFGLLWISKESIYLVVGPIYREDKGEELIDYYRLYMSGGEEYVLYLSSTNFEWLMQHGSNLEFDVVDNRKVRVYKIDPLKARYRLMSEYKL